MKRSTPKSETGRHKHQLHRRLTPDVGHPKLREHMASVVTVMKLSDKYTDFVLKLDRVHPRFGSTYEMDLGEGSPEDEGL